MKFGITILLLLAFATAWGKTLPVGRNAPFLTLRQAIAAAENGDTILLNKGLYKEGNLVIRKSICLIGVGEPVLDGEYRNEILTVSGQRIVIKGIHFVNAGYSSMNDYAAVKIIGASNVLVEQNQITNASFAIHVSNTTNSIIRSNVIKGASRSEHLSGNGIHLWKCNQMTIEGNIVQGHRDGIYFEFVTGSVIRQNRSEKNVRYGLHFMFSHSDTYLNNIFSNNGAGVAVMYSKKVRMEKNTFEKNWGASSYGILLKDISDSYIDNNTFVRNTVAIHMEGSSRIEVARNVFKENGWALKVQASCDDNLFHHNNFSGNSFDVATNGTRTLNRFYNNYWDRYEGYDINKDGVGDVSYRPVSMYAMLVEQNPTTLLLNRSFMVSLLDKAEKALPGITPVNLVDETPSINPNRL